MRLIEALADAFIATFGITQPDAKTRQRASWFILGLLIVTLVAVAAVGFALYHFMHN